MHHSWEKYGLKAEYRNHIGSRRSFLKATGLAAIGSAIAALTASSAADDGLDIQFGSASIANQTPMKMVNLLQGTESTPVFSRDNTLPIAALPFGMGALDTRIESRSSMDVPAP
jgi:hypothetical protein